MGNIALVLTFYIGNSPVYHWCAFPGTTKFRGTTTLLPECSSIEMGMLFASFKLAIEWKFYRDANLSWVDIESCSTTSLTCPLIEKRHANQLLGLGRDIILTMVAVISAHYVMDRHAE